MNISICEDVLAHREHLIPLILEFFKMKSMPCEILEYSSGTELLCANKKFDIVFLDIELGDMSGIDIAGELKKQNPNCVIIVVTSYPDYLDAAMDLHVARFIKKPAKQEKVFSALEKALQEINEKLIVLSTKNNEYIRIKSSDIIFVEARLKSVRVITINRTYTVKESLKKIKEILVSSVFAVPHNSYIVNMNYISKFQREEITVEWQDMKEIIQVSNRKQPEMKQRFLEFVGDGI